MRILIGAGGLLVILALLSVGQFIETHGLTSIVIRFAVGLHLDGKKRTDARFLRRARTGHEDASAWSHQPHIVRALVRWSCLTLVIAVTFGLLKHRQGTLDALIIGGAVGLLILAWQVTRRIKTHQHMSALHSPLALALAPLLQTSPAIVSQSLTVKSDYAKAKSNERIGMLVLPDRWHANPGQREVVEHLMHSRLGVELTCIWHTTKHPFTLEICRAAIPPKMVRFSHMIPVIRNLKPNEVLLGVTGRGDYKVWDLMGEDPHGLVAANTRRGKSRLAMLIMAQVLNRGGEVIAVDPKRVGLGDMLAGHPKAKIYADPRDVEGSMWKPIQEFKQILDERIDAVMADRTAEESFSRILLVIDEISIWSMLSKLRWSEIKTGQQKATPPVFYDLASCLFAGAQFKMSVLVFGQRLDHSIIGGAIESFGTRLLAGYTKQSWMRLVGTTPIPLSQKPRGRFAFFDGTEPVWIQTVLGEVDELNAYAREPYMRNTVSAVSEDRKVNQP